MTTYTDTTGETFSITNKASLQYAIRKQAFHTSTAVGIRAAIWDSFKETFNGAPNAFDQFIMTIGETMAETFTQVAVAEVEAYLADDDNDCCEWDKFRQISKRFDAFWLANHATKKWVAEKCGGKTYTFNRLTMSKIFAGESYTASIFEKKKGGKKVSPTATAKSTGQKAEGAKVPNAIEGAIALETLTGDIHNAKNALLEILKAYPELANQKSVIQAFHSASTKAAKKSAAKKAADKKAA